MWPFRNWTPRSSATFAAGLVADALQGPDRGQVQRQLEGLSDANRAALEAVGVLRRPAAAEVGRDVEQEAARRQRPLVERRGVDDRLERRARLPERRRRVVLRLELPALEVLAVVAAAADVGEDVAGPVVQRDERAVVEVLVPEVVDPAPVDRP